MNKFIKGKTSLIIFSVAMVVVSFLCVAGSIGLIIWGANIVKEAMAGGIVLIVVGSLLSLLFLSGIVYGFIMYFTGKSLVALNGSIAEDNLAKGTVNMVKCPNCGAAVESGNKFCSKCGKSLEKTKKCPKCGKENSADSAVCIKCGTELK